MGKFIIVISPSKSLSEIKNDNFKLFTTPPFLRESGKLVDELKKLSFQELGNLLAIGEKLAILNWERYQKWSTPFTLANSRQALLSFSGDVYAGLKSADFSSDDIAHAQGHLRIISGLYGLLRPTDLIQPYRLEMGINLKVLGKQSLYDFWRKLITDRLNEEIGGKGLLVNLASAEYFKAIDLKFIKGKLVNIEFRENKPDGLKVIPILSKRARGLMARYAIKNKINDPDQLKLFDYEGYMYSDPLSTESKWVFIR